MTRSMLLRRGLAALAGAVIVLCSASPAFAAGPWSAPQIVPGGYLARWDTPMGGALHAFPGLLAFTPGATGYAVLGDDKGRRGYTTLDATTGSFRPVRSSRFLGVDPTLMAVYGRDGVMLAGGATGPGDRRSPLNAQVPLGVAVTRGTVAGAFARQLLARGVVTYFRGNVRSIESATVTALAANAAGDAAAVVDVPVRGHISVVGFRPRLFIRHRGQPAFRRVADLGRRTVGRHPAALALNGAGDVLVAWDDRDSVRARVVSVAGRLGAEQRLGRGGSSWLGAARMVASMDANRRMLVAWLAQRIGGLGSAGGPGIVAYAYAPAHQRFGAARVLQGDLPRGMDRGIGPPGVQAALLSDGAVVVWTGYTTGRFAVRAVDVRSGRPSAPVDLSPVGTDAALCSMAVGPRGGLAVAWSSSGRPGTSPTPPAGLYVRARAAATTTWGSLETIVTMAAGDFVPGGVPLAADPVTGRTVMLWSDPVTTAPGPPGVLTTHSGVRTSPDAR